MTGNSLDEPIQLAQKFNESDKAYLNELERAARTSPWVTIEEAAKLLGKDPRTIWRLKAAGKMPERVTRRVNKPGSRCYYYRSDIEAMIAARAGGVQPV